MNNETSYSNPDIVVWEITLKCNLKCLHCGSAAGERRKDELTTKEVLKLCEDLSEIGFKGIALMGGEVFLRKDWKIISKEIKDSGISLSIITNGFFRPEKIIPELVKLETDCVMIGMDGSNAETQDKIRGVKGAFDTAWKFIRAAKKANLETGVITTVHKLNFKDLPKMKDLVYKEEVDWQIQPAGVIGRFPEELMLTDEEYYSLGLYIHSLQKNHTKDFTIVGVHNLGFHSRIIPDVSFYPTWEGCYAGKTVLGIQSNGNVKGCLAMSDKHIEDNIRNRSIVEIWNDPSSFAYNRQFKIEDLGENCKDCKYGASCKGGCSTRSSTLTGKMHNDPMCFYRFEKNNLTE